MVMTVREERELTHENRRRDLLLKSYRYASVGEVDESNSCNGRCQAYYKAKLRMVAAHADCPAHNGRGAANASA